MKAHPSVQPLYKCCAHVGIPWGADFCFCLSETAEPRALGLKLSTGLGGVAQKEGQHQRHPCLPRCGQREDCGDALGLFVPVGIFKLVHSTCTQIDATGCVSG